MAALLRIVNTEGACADAAILRETSQTLLAAAKIAEHFAHVRSVGDTFGGADRVEL